MGSRPNHGPPMLSVFIPRGTALYRVLLPLLLVFVIAAYQWRSRHAEIRPAGQDNVITDVGSANGTYVNGQRLDWNVPRLLRNGAETSKP